MYLKNLSLINFKNYLLAEIDFSPSINCFTGNNGVGKTNLLDAVYYLALCKSYFNPIDYQNINFTNDFFVIEGKFDINKKDNNIYCGLKRNQKKKVSRNKKEYKRLSEHVGLIPIVMVSPADIKLIVEGSEERRKFIDAVISQYDKSYLESVISYNKALLQRNKLLKQFSENNYFDNDELEIWNYPLIQHGIIIYKKRKEFIDQITGVFQKHHEYISNGKEKVTLNYKSDLDEGDFKKILHSNLNKDRILQYTTKGVHKDDLLMKMEGYAIKKSGSQGQQKTYLVALKLAKYDFIYGKKGIKPILLLDDIFDKFDHDRVEKMISLISNDNFGQIFITDTDFNRLNSILAKIENESKIFNITENQEITFK